MSPRRARKGLGPFRRYRGGAFAGRPETLAAGYNELDFQCH